MTGSGVFERARQRPGDGDELTFVDLEVGHDIAGLREVLDQLQDIVVDANPTVTGQRGDSGLAVHEGQRGHLERDLIARDGRRVQGIGVDRHEDGRSKALSLQKETGGVIADVRAHVRYIGLNGFDACVRRTRIDTFCNTNVRRRGVGCAPSVGGVAFRLIIPAP